MRRLPLCIASAILAVTLGAGVANAGDSDNSDAPKIDLKAIPSNLEQAIRDAQVARAAGRLDEATHALSQLMLVAPDDARVVGEYGKVLAQRGQGEDATAFLRRAIEINSNDWTLYSALGVAYDEQGKPKDARLAYQRALALKPGDPSILNNIAMSRMVSGDLAGARDAILQAKAVDGGDTKIERNVALVESRAPAGLSAKTAVSVPAAAPSQSAPAHGTAPSAVASIAPSASQPAASRALGAPRVLVPNAVMEKVPSDPLAGPTSNSKTKSAKPVHVAVKKTAPTTAPAKSSDDASKKAKTPALRMSADAS